MWGEGDYLARVGRSPAGAPLLWVLLLDGGFEQPEGVCGCVEFRCDAKREDHYGSVWPKSMLVAMARWPASNSSISFGAHTSIAR